MTELKMEYVLIFAIVAFMLYHFMNSGLSCSCAKWRNMEGFDVSAVSNEKYCGGRKTYPHGIEGTGTHRCEQISTSWLEAEAREAGVINFSNCNSRYDKDGFLCAPPIGSSIYCTYTPVTLTDKDANININNENWGDPDNLDRTVRRPALDGYYAKCNTWPIPTVCEGITDKDKCNNKFNDNKKHLCSWCEVVLDRGGGRGPRCYTIKKAANYSFGVDEGTCSNLPPIPKPTHAENIDD